MEAIEPRLLEFLPAMEEGMRILVVEGADYLPLLRVRCPQAELYAVAADGDVAEREELQGLGISWQFLDYLSAPLPYSREFFDYIISDLTLEQAANPQDIAAGFSQFLKQTGAFLTSFRNIRHWSVLQDLMEGHYYNVCTRLYTKSEFARLLYASYYKDVRFAAQERLAPAELKSRLEAAGFEELDEIDAEFYMVYAARSMPELSLLKSMYTAEERKLLSRLLHRMEYEIQMEASVRSFWAFYDEHSLFPDYLAAFVHEAVFHHVSFYRQLWTHSTGREEILMEVFAQAEFLAGQNAGELIALREEFFADFMRRSGDGI